MAAALQRKSEQISVIDCVITLKRRKFHASGAPGRTFVPAIGGVEFMLIVRIFTQNLRPI